MAGTNLLPNTGEVKQFEAGFRAQFKQNLIREETFEGRTFLAFPVVALVEGVLNGGLITADEFGFAIQSWDGRPVVLRHPFKNGRPISANSPEVLQQMRIGWLFMSKMDGKKFKAEAWLDKQKIEDMAGSALDMLTAIQNGNMIEVSTGYYAAEEEKTGVFNGVEYDHVQHYFKPDHLAFLVDEEGACSIADGCGAPRIQAGKCSCGCEGTGACKEKQLNTNDPVAELATRGDDSVKTLIEVLQSVKQETSTMESNGKRLAVVLSKMLETVAGSADGVTTETLIAKIATRARILPAKVTEILSGTLEYPPYDWLCAFAEVLGVSEWLLIDAAGMDGMDYMDKAADDSGDYGPMMMSKVRSFIGVLAKHFAKKDKPVEEVQTVSIANCVRCNKPHENLEVASLEGYPDSVHRIYGGICPTTQKPILHVEDRTSEGGSSENRSAGSVTEPSTRAIQVQQEESVDDKKKTAIDKLIAHEGTAFKEADRVGLEAMQLETLEALLPKDPAPVAQAAAPVLDNAAIASIATAVAALLPNTGIDAETRAALSDIASQRKTYRAALVTKLTTQSRVKFTETELVAFPSERLEQMTREYSNDFSGRGMPGANADDGQGDDDEVPEPLPIVLRDTSQDRVQ